MAAVIGEAASPLLSVALDYAAHGVPVFPVYASGAGPSRVDGVAGTGGLRRATTDEAQLREWFGETGWSGAVAVGIPTGRQGQGGCGWIVVDIDEKDGKGGGDTWAALLAEAGEAEPHCLEALTKSGGRHLYFLAPEWAVKTQGGQLGAGIDVRGDGGYVRAVGSPGYEWEGELDGYGGVLGGAAGNGGGAWGGGVPALPQWLAQRLWRVSAGAGGASGGIVVRAPVSTESLLERIRAGEDLHDAVVVLAARWQQDGVAEDVVVDMLARAVLGGEGRGERRRELVESGELARCVEGARKFRPVGGGAGAGGADGVVSGQNGVERAPEGEKSGDSGEKATKTKRARLEWVVASIQDSAEWEGVIGRNMFAGGRIDKRVATPVGTDAGPWDDMDSIALLHAISRSRPDWTVGREMVEQAVSEIARLNSFDPVAEYLDGLQWDGQPRVETWLARYLGAELTEYSSTVGRKWLIAAAARVLDPGCKADNVLVLEGEQGVGKSSALGVLGGEWFLDSPVDLAGKEAGHSIQGAWLIELPELEGMRKTETTRLKQFFSLTVDQYRAPYGRHMLWRPRRCVFAATTNERAYLMDETGHRRFWPVLTAAAGPFDLEGLRSDRDQIWAEAVALWRSGAVWHAEAFELSMLGAEQAKRGDEDVWDGPIAKWCATQTGVGVTILGVLEHLGVDVAHANSREGRRVGRALRKMGWVVKGQAKPRKYFPPMKTPSNVGALPRCP